jgi:glycosyltransferase involved in cell wall biosynthesis
VTLSVVIVTHNEEANLGRTLQSALPLVSKRRGEIIVVDSGSTESTVRIAESYGAKVFVEDWKGYASQKNSAIEKATGDWILSLDADEELDTDLQKSLAALLESLDLIASFQRSPGGNTQTVQDARAEAARHIRGTMDENFAGVRIPRKNHFLGRWIRHGGFWPDPKLRLFRRGAGDFQGRPVHESVEVRGSTGSIRSGALLHHSYPTLSDYVDHMNRYASLGAEMVIAEGKGGFSFVNIVLRPLLTFVYNYFFRLGFLDGREGLLLHLYHAVYVSWKYAKVWEHSHRNDSTREH